MLSRQEQDFYRDRGYLVVERAFDETRLAELRGAIRELLEASRAVAKSGAVYDLGPEHSAERPQVRRIKHPHLQHAAFDAVMRSPEILDRVAPLRRLFINYASGLAFDLPRLAR